MSTNPPPASDATPTPSCKSCPDCPGGMMYHWNAAGAYRNAESKVEWRCSTCGRREPLNATPTPGECWCETCRPNTMLQSRMILCPVCGNKRCPRATHHDNACTGSNEPGQKGSSWENYPAHDVHASLRAIFPHRFIMVQAGDIDELKARLRAAERDAAYCREMWRHEERDRDEKREALRRANITFSYLNKTLFAVPTSDKWAELEWDRMEAEKNALIAERDALARFKAYVHRRLDEAGVPVDPDSPHKAEGCRIGGRLDVVFAERDALRAAVEEMAEALRLATIGLEAIEESKSITKQLRMATALALPKLRAALARGPAAGETTDGGGKD
jgi:hypothetical protein